MADKSPSVLALVMQMRSRTTEEKPSNPLPTLPPTPHPTPPPSPPRRNEFNPYDSKLHLSSRDSTISLGEDRKVSLKIRTDVASNNEFKAHIQHRRKICAERRSLLAEICWQERDLIWRLENYEAREDRMKKVPWLVDQIKEKKQRVEILGGERPDEAMADC